jgi:hypothetical protein
MGNLANLIQGILKELSSDPLKVPPGNELMIQMIISLIVDACITLLDEKKFNEESIILIKMVLISATLDKLDPRSMLIKFVVKKNRKQNNFSKLDDIIKKVALKQMTTITKDICTKIRLDHLKKQQNK